MNISPYNKEQLDTMLGITDFLHNSSASQITALKNKISDYLLFRKDISIFFEQHFSNICQQKCYENRLSACCTKEGIITFFADMVINTLCSTAAQQNDLISALQNDHSGNKCVYLGKTGCIWQVKPIVCEMFLCDSAKKDVFSQHIELEKKWTQFKQLEKRFKWPDKPVLFDELETIFIKRGFSFPLMYFHNSPGLLRIKKQASLQT